MLFDALVDGTMYGLSGGEYDYYVLRDGKLFGLGSCNEEEYPVEITDEIRSERDFYDLRSTPEEEESP